MSFYLMHRGWMDTPALTAGREPFCRRAAWAWLIEEAAWVDRSVNGRGKTIQLQRGQLCHSYRFLAEAWGWSLAAVQRFMIRLQTDTMIDTKSDAGILVITICNYDTYQSNQGRPDTRSDTVPDTPAVRGRYTGGTNEKEGKEGKNITPDSTSPVSAGPTPGSDLFGGATVVRLPSDLTEQAAALWNAMAVEVGLSQVRTLTQQRRTALRARLKECGGLDGWREALDQVRASSFLRGENDRGWKADLDFVLQAKSFAKLREGVYANRGKPAVGGKLSWMVEEMRQRAAAAGSMRAADGKLSWLAAEMGLDQAPPGYDLDLTAEGGR